MLSIVTITSGIIFSAAEVKPTPLMGMTIFNNGIKLKIRAMISADRNISSDYKMPGRETVRGLLLDNFFENYMKNQREKLLNG